MIDKAILKKDIKHYKEMFDRTNNNDYIIEATVAYAIYNALGGKQLIPLPPFTESLYNIVYSLAVVKTKVGDKMCNNVARKMEKHIKYNVGIIQAIELIDGFGIRLKVYTLNNIYLLDATENTALIITRLATICIMEQGTLGKGKPFMQDMIYKYLIEVGRA